MMNLQNFPVFQKIKGVVCVDIFQTFCKAPKLINLQCSTESMMTSPPSGAPRTMASRGSTLVTDGRILRTASTTS